jgi:hypothetical protein
MIFLIDHLLHCITQEADVLPIQISLLYSNYHATQIITAKSEQPEPGG